MHIATSIPVFDFSNPNMPRLFHTPIVSIVIINWNGQRVLSRCIDAVFAQSCTDFETIIVDNASNDSVVEELRSDSRLEIVGLEQNYGFAAANNIGARIARGKWLALLNNDAFPTPEWLAELITIAEAQPPETFYAPRLVQANDSTKLDGEGDVYHVSGLAWRRNHNKNILEASNRVEEVFSACAAAALYPREAFIRVGGFDEDFFSYHEDIDLAFRLRLQGYRCLYVPTAVVAHIGSASLGKRSDFALYYGHRNLVWTFFKDMPTPLLQRYLPWHIAANLFFLIYYSLKGRTGVICQSKLDALRGLKNALAKRKIIQQSRRVSADDLLKVMDRSWSVPYTQLLSRR